MVEAIEKKGLDFKVTQIMPMTKRTEELLAQKEALQAEAASKAERDEKLKLEHETREEMERLEVQRKKGLEEKKRAEEAAKKAAEEEQSKKLEGKMKKLMIQLQNNTLEETTITLAGLQLGKQRTAILSKSLQVNENLHTLHMARKGMQDEEGEDFINRIKRNKYLENIELEGNELGANSAKRIGEWLMTNETLKILDLEANNLTNDLQDRRGIEQIANAIKTNTTLLSLNLNTCNLDDQCGVALVEAIKENYQLIRLDIGGNRLTLQQIQ